MLYGNQVILAAHRGDKKRYPENTMPAFEAAVRSKVDMIETDIHMTRDGVLVIMHDRSAKRTAGVDRHLDEMLYEEVRKLDAGALFGETFTGEKVPTVAEFLDYIKNTNLYVNWELKDYPAETGDAHAFGAADQLIRLIDEAGFGERSMVNSFSDRVLAHIEKEHGHRFPIHGQGIYHSPHSHDLSDRPREELYDWCCMYPEEKGHLATEYRENFDYCVQNRILPCVCMPDTLENYQKALEFGCKMFTSNDIILGDAVLRELGVRE